MKTTVEFVVRAARGLFMFAMFVFFAAGIGLLLLLFVPVGWLAQRRRPASAPVLREPVRALISLWVTGLGLGRLLRTVPPTGAPAPGPCVLVANHPGLFDVLVLIREVPGLAVLAKRELRDRLPLAPIFRQCGYLFAPGEADPRTTETFLREATERLRAGDRLLFFPEGTRSPRGALHAFRSGAFRLAERAGVPIQPVVVRNDPPFLPHEDRWYFPLASSSTLCVEFLAPVAPPEPGSSRDLARRTEARIREALGLKGTGP